MEVEAALEPEEVLKAVVDAEPVVAVVHELNACLDDADLLVDDDGVDQLEEVGMDVVLGVEHGHELPPGDGKANVEPVRLVDRVVAEGQHLDVPVADVALRTPRLADCPDIIRVADDEDLEEAFRVVH